MCFCVFVMGQTTEDFCLHNDCLLQCARRSYTFITMSWSSTKDAFSPMFLFLNQHDFMGCSARFDFVDCRCRASSLLASLAVEFSYFISKFSILMLTRTCALRFLNSDRLFIFISTAKRSDRISIKLGYETNQNRLLCLFQCCSIGVTWINWRFSLLEFFIRLIGTNQCVARRCNEFEWMFDQQTNFSTIRRCLGILQLMSPCVFACERERVRDEMFLDDIAHAKIHTKKQNWVTTRRFFCFFSSRFSVASRYVLVYSTR